VTIIPPQYKLAAEVAGVVALCAAMIGGGFAGGWAVNGWRLGTAVATAKTQEARERADEAQRVAEALKAAQTRAQALQDRLAAIDADGNETLRRIQRENDALRGAVAAGSRVVRINGASCPGRADVPQAPASGGLDHGTSAELTAGMGQRILNLRAGIGQLETQLAACQDALAAERH
jgi:hypothetical protein